MAFFEAPDWAIFLFNLFPLIILAFIGGIASLTFLWLRARHRAKVKFIRTSIVFPVSEQGKIGFGQMIKMPNRTEDYGFLEHPDWKDEAGEQYAGEFSLTGKVPLEFIDEKGKIFEMWPVFNVDGQLVAGSMESMLYGAMGGNNGHSIDQSKLQALATELSATTRSPTEIMEYIKANLPFGPNGHEESLMDKNEPEVVNPRKVGHIFIGWGALRQNAGRILRSGTFWAIIIPTGLLLYVLGVITEVARIGHF